MCECGSMASFFALLPLLPPSLPRLTFFFALSRAVLKCALTFSTCCFMFKL